MDATTLATEATRYLEAIALLRLLGLDVNRRSEADEARVLSPPAVLQRPRRCTRCAGPLVRINGQNVCFQTRTNDRGRPRCQR
jgi:hypothetical protein